MSERNRTVWPWIAVLVLVPVLYVLSIGPVFWLLARFAAGSENIAQYMEAFSAAYAPIFYLRDRSERCEAVLNWYLVYGLPEEFTNLR